MGMKPRHNSGTRRFKKPLKKRFKLHGVYQDGEILGYVDGKPIYIADEQGVLRCKDGDGLSLNSDSLFAVVRDGKWIVEDYIVASLDGFIKGFKQYIDCDRLKCDDEIAELTGYDVGWL